MQFLLLVAFLASFITVHCGVVTSTTSPVTTTGIFDPTADNLYYCQNTWSCPPHSACTGRIPNNTTWGFCECIPGHITFKNETFCDYAETNWLAPFLCDLFLDPVFPVGQFIATGGEINFDTLQGRINFVQIFMTGCVGFCIDFAIVMILVTIARINKRFDTYYASSNSAVYDGILYFFYITCTLSTFVWWIVNIVRNTTGLTTDANGIPID